MASESFEFHTWLGPHFGPAYEEFHRAIPVELHTAMRAAGVLGWQIYRNDSLLTHRVIAEDRRRLDTELDSHPVNQRWQREVAPFLSAQQNSPVFPDDRGTLIWDFSWPTR